MIIAVPNGVKLFNWLFTMYRGRLRGDGSGAMERLCFMVTFHYRGMKTGVLTCCNQVADYVLHNSLFLNCPISHNTNHWWCGFGYLALVFCFPGSLKRWAFTTPFNVKLGKAAVLGWLVVFLLLAFMPLLRVWASWV